MQCFPVRPRMCVRNGPTLCPEQCESNRTTQSEFQQPPRVTAMSGSNWVNRGGRGNNNAIPCRASNRNPDDSGNRNDNLGFRLRSAWQGPGWRFTDRLRVRHHAQTGCPASVEAGRPLGPRRLIGFSHRGRHGLSRSRGAVCGPARGRGDPAQGAAGRYWGRRGDDLVCCCF